MEVRFLPNDKSYVELNTDKMRENFLITSLFQKDEVTLLYADTDRTIVGSAIPATRDLKLLGSKKEMACEYFAERREIGIINIGGDGVVTVDGTKYELENKDALYITKGSKEIIFEKMSSTLPKYYIVSYPAHMSYENKLIKSDEAIRVELGEIKTSNKRVIRKYICRPVVESCQLVMGLTELAEGCVWNTMPPHTHQRRSEVYMYFDLTDEALVFHLMGKPEETRHIVMRNEQAVINPSWSIHSAAATENYSFIWGMGGENQEFDDMDWVSFNDIK